MRVSGDRLAWSAGGPTTSDICTWTPAGGTVKLTNSGPLERPPCGVGRPGGVGRVRRQRRGDLHVDPSGGTSRCPIAIFSIRTHRCRATASCGSGTTATIPPWRSTPGLRPAVPSGSRTTPPWTLPPGVGRPDRVVGLSRHVLRRLYVDAVGRDDRGHDQQCLLELSPKCPATASSGKAPARVPPRSTPGLPTSGVVAITSDTSSSGVSAGVGRPRRLAVDEVGFQRRRRLDAAGGAVPVTTGDNYWQYLVVFGTSIVCPAGSATDSGTDAGLEGLAGRADRG